VLLETFASEGLNAAVLVSHPDKGEAAMVIAVKVKEGRKLDSALRDLQKSLPTELKKKLPVAWNHDRQGSARIHRGRLLAEKEDFYLAVRDDLVVFGDKDSLKFLKATLAALPGKEAPLVPLFYARGGPRAFLTEADQRRIAEKALSATERERLSAELSLSGGKEVNLRLRISAPLVRVWSRLAAE